MLGREEDSEIDVPESQGVGSDLSLEDGGFDSQEERRALAERELMSGCERAGPLKLTKKTWSEVCDIFMDCFRSGEFQRELTKMSEELLDAGDVSDQARESRMVPLIDTITKPLLKRAGFSELFPRGIRDFVSPSIGIDETMQGKLDALFTLVQRREVKPRAAIAAAAPASWSYLSRLPRGHQREWPEEDGRLTKKVWIKLCDIVLDCFTSEPKQFQRGLSKVYKEGLDGGYGEYTMRSKLLAFCDTLTKPVLERLGFSELLPNGIIDLLEPSIRINDTMRRKLEEIHSLAEPENWEDPPSGLARRLREHKQREDRLKEEAQSQQCEMLRQSPAESAEAPKGWALADQKETKQRAAPGTSRLRKVRSLRGPTAQSAEHATAATPANPVDVWNKDTWNRVHELLFPCFKDKGFQRQIIELYDELQVADAEGENIYENVHARMSALCDAAARPAVEHLGFSEVGPHGIASLWFDWFAQTERVSPRRIDKAMQSKVKAMERLLSPEVLARSNKVNPTYLQPREGRLWRVVGGVIAGGIVVRFGEDLKSAELTERLAHDAIVEEIELVRGRRLHYRILAGDGPTYGWVSTVRTPNVEYFMQPWPQFLRGPEGKHLAAYLHDRISNQYLGGA